MIFQDTLVVKKHTQQSRKLTIFQTLDINTYTRKLKLPNEQIHAKPLNGATTAFLEFSLYFNHRISMDTKGPISPSSDGNSYVYVIVDAFTHYVVLHPSHKKDATNALTVLFDHWIAELGIPDNLITDDGNEYINGEFTHLCRTYNVQFKPSTPYAPWSNGLVENSNRQLNTFLRKVLDSQYDTWSQKVKVFPFAFNSQVKTNMNRSP